MRVPDPEKWKATKDECDGPYGLIYGTRKDVARVYERIARRRALEELRALLKLVTSPYVDQHYGGPAPRNIDADDVEARIAEIESEGE